MLCARCHAIASVPVVASFVLHTLVSMSLCERQQIDGQICGNPKRGEATSIVSNIGKRIHARARARGKTVHSITFYNEHTVFTGIETHDQLPCWCIMGRATPTSSDNSGHRIHTSSSIYSHPEGIVKLFESPCCRTVWQSAPVYVIAACSEKELPDRFTHTRKVPLNC